MTERHHANDHANKLDQPAIYEHTLTEFLPKG